MFSGSDSIGFVWSGVGQALVQFLQLLAVFAISAVLATLMTP